MFGLGGELAKEVAFVFMFCYYFVQAHFVFVQAHSLKLDIGQGFDDSYLGLGIKHSQPF